MDHDAFRDYCKAENSEDEEVNYDLQSRLYAEIYYGPSDIETIDVKPNIKYENNADNETGQVNESTVPQSAPNDNLNKDNYGTNQENSGHSSMITEKDDKTSIKLIVTANEIDTSHNNINNQSNLPSVKSVEHFVGNVKSVNNNVQSSSSKNMENVKNSLDCQNTLSERNIAEAETELDSKEHLKTLQCLNPETPVNESSCNNTEKTQELATKETELNDNCDNILNKYNYLKVAINNLYIKKYVDLEEKLQRIEEEKERCLKEAESKKDEENKQQANPANQMDTESRYDVVAANEKTPKVSDSTVTIMVSSETDSDSEDSILEVPIPPKPQPPVINLNDSDESSDLCSSNDSDDEELPTVIECVNDSSKKTTDKSDKGEKSLDTNAANEDIVLNCTDIQKCATSIQEIRDTSRSVQSSSACNENDSGILYYPFSDDENMQNSYIPSKPTAKSNFVYERDKEKTVSFAEDIVLSNCLKSNESTTNKRRHNESDNEHCTNAERTESRCHENKRSKVNPEEHTNHDKNNSQRWQEYFFRPMSDNVKDFYNESRGQENFDIREIQNNMSKDPRLWTILDEDLMPGLNRHRYWNSKNNHCNYPGRQRHNYAEQSKPPRCHMCGSEGHTEARCPEKMCLTCGKKQGTFRKTCESCRILYCNMCGAVGHKSTECPDLWRRFHQTTQNSAINIPDNLSDVMKPADLLYCCNCTKRGHDSSTCNEYRWSQHFPTPAYVSNYVDGPEYENTEPHAVSSKNEDVILLSDTKKHKTKTFEEGQDNLEGCFVVFSYGQFLTKNPNGEEVKKNLINDQIHASQLTNFFKGRILPSFLDNLKKVVNFEIKVYYDEKRELMTRVRSIADVAPRICDIFVFWLKLSDEDKHLEVCVNFPRATKKMLRYLNSKLGELEKELNDPNKLYNEIMRQNTKLSNAKDSSEAASISKMILRLRGKLMKVFHAKPRMSDSVMKLKKLVKSVAAAGKRRVDIPLYLSIALTYNKIFIPRKLTDTEMTRLRKNYYNAKIETRRKKREEKKAQTISDPYESLIRNLISYNNRKSKPNTPPLVDNSDAMQSTRSSEKNNTQTSTVISASVTNPVKDNVQCSDNTEDNIKTTCIEKSDMRTNTDESDAVYPIERIQLPRNENVPSSSEALDIIEQASIVPSDSVPLPKLADLVKQSKHDRSNLITVPIKDKELPGPQKNNVPCPEARSPQNNTEKSSGTTSTNTETIETSTSKQDDASCSSDSISTKKKVKKSKKRKSDENNSEPTTNHSINHALWNKANAVMNEALGFNLPYMNKAVEEVRKRINDGRLKQEHVDVLQRLINLENDHQKYVSSFCNYLQ
nr:PREDICTED: uncharacterized protein LOC100881772 isoform X1 [Megachile rotundata]